jgi:hypothetical protein
VRKVTESIEDLNEVSELVKRLREKELGQCEKAALLKEIGIKLRPYIEGISNPVSLAWETSIDGDEYTAVSPKSKYTVNDLSSGKGIVLWSPSTRLLFSSSPTGDQLWLLSSGKFLYIKTLEHKTDRGVGWSFESWVGEPIENDDPSKLPLPTDMQEICDNILNAVNLISQKLHVNPV